MERINYDTAKQNWTEISKTDKNGNTTTRMRLTLRYYDKDGKRRGKTRVFPEDMTVDLAIGRDGTPKHPRKRDEIVRKWIQELNEEQEAAIKAEEEEAVRQAAEAARAALPSANMTVADYATSYIDTLEAAGTVRASAISDYRTSCKRISEGIGDVVLGNLTPAMIQAWEGDLLKAGKGVNTVLKYHRLLNSVFNHALAVRDVTWNPCAAVKKPRRVDPSPNSLDALQFARLTATLSAMEPTPRVVAAYMAMFTGMREGEVCGLRWSRYDEDAGIIQVDTAIAKAGGKKYITEPKTAAGRRNIPVHPKLAEMLERRRAAMVEELEEAGIKYNETEFGELFVCGSIDGRYCDNTILSRSWKALAEDFNLIGTQGRRITFHDLRHTFATRAIAAGADVKAVAAVLGHTDARVTLNVYADADKESKRRATDLAGSHITTQGDVKPFAALAHLAGTE